MAKKKKRIRKKKPLQIRFFTFLIFLAILIFGGIYVIQLPIFEIREVVVNGCGMLAPEEIRALAGVPLSENLFFANLSRARSNLKKVTPIKKASFYRIPPATILINIEEREPMAAIIFPQRSIIIDEEGIVLNRNPNLRLDITNVEELPVVTGMRQSDIWQKDRIDNKAAQVVSDIINKLSPYLELRSMQIELGNLSKINFLLDDLLKVKVGDANNISKKMGVFQTLLPEIAGKWDRVIYVDVRYPDYPVIKFK